MKKISQRLLICTSFLMPVDCMSVDTPQSTQTQTSNSLIREEIEKLNEWASTQEKPDNFDNLIAELTLFSSKSALLPVLSEKEAKELTKLLNTIMNNPVDSYFINSLSEHPSLHRSDVDEHLLSDDIDSRIEHVLMQNNNLSYELQVRTGARNLLFLADISEDYRTKGKFNIHANNLEDFLHSIGQHKILAADDKTNIDLVTPLLKGYEHVISTSNNSAQPAILGAINRYGQDQLDTDKKVSEHDKEKPQRELVGGITYGKGDQ